MPYARLRKEWAKKNFNLPALPENSPLAEHLFHELNKLDSLQREAQRTRAALTSKERRGIIHYELNKDSYRLYQDHLAWPSKAQKAHAKLIQQSDAIGIRAADAEKDIISELKSPAIQDAIQKELNQLEKQKGEKNNQKTEEEKKANHEVITAAIVKEIAVIDAQIKQLKSFLDDLAQENKEPNIIKSIKEFTRDQLRIGSDPGSLVTADDDNEVINWVKGGKKREAAANGVFKSFRKYKVGNKTFKAEYEDSADGTKFLLAATHMKKKGKWGLNNPEYWGKKERKGRINVDYEKMVMEGYKTYSLDEGYGQSDNSAKRWQEKNIQETADYMRTLAAKEIIAARSGEEFKDHLPTFKQPIQVMEGLAENQRTSGYARRLNTLIRLNNEVETQNAELSGLKLDQISRLASTRGTKTVKQIIATKNSVIAARHVAALARDLVALALDKISIHYSGAHNSAKVLEALTSACRDAQEAYSMAHAEIEHAKKELERQKGLLRPEHPDLVALEAEIKHAEEKLGEALAAITRARNSVIAMTKIPADQNAESLQDAITLKREVMTILAKVIATDENSVTTLARIIADSENPDDYNERLEEIKEVIRANASNDYIEQAFRLDPTETMAVLNDAHHAIASRLAPEMNERIVDMLDTVENAGARLVSLNEEAAKAAAGAIQTNNDASNAVITYGNNVDVVGAVTQAVAELLAQDVYKLSANQVVSSSPDAAQASAEILTKANNEAIAASVLLASDAGRIEIENDNDGIAGILSVSAAGRAALSKNDAAVLEVMKVSDAGRNFIAMDKAGVAVVASVDADKVGEALKDKGSDTLKTSAAAVVSYSDKTARAAAASLAKDTQETAKFLANGDNTSGRAVITGNLKGVDAVLKNSKIARHTLADDDKAVSAVINASVAGQEYIALDAAGFKASVRVDVATAVKVLSDVAHNESAKAALLASDQAFNTMDKETFFGLMQISSEGCGVVAEDRFSFINLLKASEESRRSIADDDAVFRVLMQNSQVGRVTLASEIAAINSDLAAKVVMESSLGSAEGIIQYDEVSRSAAVQVLAQEEERIVSAISRDAELCEELFKASLLLENAGEENGIELPISLDSPSSRAARVRHFLGNNPKEVLARFSDKQNQAVLKSFFSESPPSDVQQQMVATALKSTGGVALKQSPIALRDTISSEFLKNATTEDIKNLNSDSRLQATTQSFAVAQNHENNPVVKAMMGENFKDIRQQAVQHTYATVNLLGSAEAKQIFDATDSVNLVAAKAAVQQDGDVALVSLRENQFLNGALTRAMSTDVGVAAVSRPETKKAIVKGIFAAGNGKRVFDKIKSVSPGVASGVLRGATDAAVSADVDGKMIVAKAISGNDFNKIRGDLTCKALEDPSQSKKVVESIAKISTKNEKSTLLEDALATRLQEDNGKALDDVSEGVTAGMIAASIAADSQAINASGVDLESKQAVVEAVIKNGNGAAAIKSLRSVENRRGLPLVGPMVPLLNEAVDAAVQADSLQSAQAIADGNVRKNIVERSLTEDGVAVVKNLKTVVPEPNLLSMSLTTSLSDNNGKAFEAVNDVDIRTEMLAAPLHATQGEAFNGVNSVADRTNLLSTALLTEVNGVKGGAINALKADHLATYQKALKAVIELPNPEVQKEINRVLALRTPDSIAANHAIAALAGIVAADDDTINELADIIENAQVANAISAIPNTDSEVEKTKKKNDILYPDARAKKLKGIREEIKQEASTKLYIQNALAAKPLAALAALNKLHAKTQNSDEHLAILLNGHAESKELIEELINPASITAKEISKAREKNPEATQYAIDLALAASNPEFISTALDKHAGANAVMKGQAKRASSVLNDARDNTAVGERNVDLSSGVRKLQTTSVEASPAVAFAAKRIVKALSVLNQDAATTLKMREMRAAMVLAHPAGIVSNPDAVNALAHILKNQGLADDVDKAKALLENPETAAQTIQAVHAKASAEVLTAISAIPAAITLAMAATAIRENPVGAYENVKAINQTGLEAAIKNTMIGPANTALSDVEMRAMAKSSYAIHAVILCGNDISIEDKKAIAKLVPSPPAIGVLLSARRDFALKLLQDPKTSLATLMAAYAAHPKKTQRAMNALIDNKNNLKSIRETLLAEINNPLDEINGSSAVVAARNQLIANDPVAVKLAEAHLAELRQRALASLMRKHINANPEVQKARVDVTRYEIVAANFSHFSKAIPELNQVTTADEIASNRETAVKKIAEFFAANHNQRAIVDQQVTARPQLKDAVPEVAAAIRSVDLTPIEAEMQRLEETERFVMAKNLLKEAQKKCAETLAKDSTYNAAITAAQTSVFKDAYKNDTSTLLMRQVLHNEGDLSVIKNGARITFADGQWVDITGDAFFEALRKIPTHLSDDLKEVISHNEEAVQDIQACIDDKNSNGNNLKEHLVLARKIENVSKAQVERIHKLEGVLEQFLAVTPRERHKAEAEIARLKEALPELEEAHKAVYDNVKANITNARSNAYDRLKGEKTSAVYQAIQEVRSESKFNVYENISKASLANAVISDSVVCDAMAEYILANSNMKSDLAVVLKYSANTTDKADIQSALRRTSVKALTEIMRGSVFTGYFDNAFKDPDLRAALADNRSVIEKMQTVSRGIDRQPEVEKLIAIETARKAERKRNLERKSPAIAATFINNDAAWNALLVINPGLSRDAVAIQRFIVDAKEQKLSAIAEAVPAVKAAIEECISVPKLDASPEVQAAWKKAIESDSKVVDSSKSLESAKKDLSKANNDLAKLTAKTECLNSSNKVLSKQKNQLAEHGEIVKEQIRELPRRRQALKERIAEADANRIGGRFRPSSG